MPSRLPKIALVVALAISIGRHCGFLQTLAWGGMVVKYSQDAPFKDAVVMTFDGKHPCTLCKQIAQGKRSEKKSEFPPTSKKFEFSYSVSRTVYKGSTPDARKLHTGLERVHPLCTPCTRL